MDLTESWENYLETIYMLKQEKSFVRSIDVATALEYSKASVSRAVGNLRDSDYIIVNDNGGLDFTEKGLLAAEAVYEKHIFLNRFLTAIGVDKKTAAQDACRIEHVITETTFEQLKSFVATHFTSVTEDLYDR
ncbi:MAG: metal-dependent transcriptional regulator [Tissierellia bacterium]|nr:metal-dependent transcriptional regulator [Tissierellia bacterium]